MQNQEVRALLSVEETAKQLGMSAWWIRELVHRGELRAVRFGRLMKFRQAEIDRFVQASEVGAR